MVRVIFRRKKLKLRLLKLETSRSEISGNTRIPFSQNVVLNMSRKVGDFFTKYFRTMNPYFCGGMCTSWIWEFSVLGGFLNEKSLTGAFWMCFYYQNNLLRKKII